MSQQILQAVSAVHTRLTEESVPTKEQLSLAAHSTFRIGGPAALAAFPETAEQVHKVLLACREYGVPCALVGNGSNLLCPDEGFGGCVLFTTALKDIAVTDTVITAGAGAALASICCTARDRGLTGLAFAYGIPGTLGGAVCIHWPYAPKKVGAICPGSARLGAVRSGTIGLPLLNHDHA